MKRLFSLLVYVLLLQGGIAEEKVYRPEHPSDESGLTVQLSGTRLISEQDTFGRNIEVKTLAEFIRGLQANLTKTIGAPSSDYEIQVSVILTKDEIPKLELASQGEVSDDVLQKIYDGLKTIPDIRSKKDELSFQVNFKVRKKPGQAAP